MKTFKLRILYLFLLASVPVLMGFGSAPQSGSKTTSFAASGRGKHNGKVTQAELQDDLLRFETQFNARVQSADQALETSRNPKIRYRAMLNRLIYSSNSLNIALGPSPESNLLDMVTFIELSRDVLEEHWIPKVFGTKGKPLERAFSESDQQIWVIAEKVMNPKQRSVLKKVISTWRGLHSKQINVETVRLSAFSTQAGATAAGLNEDIGGLFASVEQSTQAVDAARLFAERALYYAERAPFLFRLQARLGADEIMDDARVNLSRISAPLKDQRALSGLMKEIRQTLLVTQATLGDANSTTQSVNTLMERLSKNPRAGTSVTTAINGLTNLFKEWNQLLTSPAYQKGASQMVGIASQVDAESTRFLKKLAWLGGALIVFFWVMFILSKLAYQYFQLRLFGRSQSTDHEEQNSKAA